MKRLILIFNVCIVFVLGCNSKPKPINYETKLARVQQLLLEMDSVNRFQAIQQKEAKIYSIDSLFNKIYKKNQFNGNVIVANKGQVIYQGCFGLADPQCKEPLNFNSIFQLASVSKTITSVAVLLLYEQKYFKLDDEFSKYFPDFPYKKVTIKQLLCHRSGLPNYLYIQERFYPSNKIYLSNEDVYDVLVNKKPEMMFKPDTRFFYNNTNYMLLALLIEKLSGRSYSSFVQKNIFEIIGMNSSYIELPDEFWYRNNKTFGLYANNRKYPVDRFDGVYGDKGVYSTLHDMYLFDRALYPDVLLKKSTLDMAYTNHVTESRRLKQYGLGFRMKYDLDSNKIIYHNGWWHGYRSAFHRRPKDQTCIIVLSNRLNSSVYTVVKDVFKILDQNNNNSNFEEIEEGEE